MKSQIISFENLKEYEGCVLAYGHFSTIHPGHIRFLRYAKRKGKSLVVAVVDDYKEFGLEKYQFSQNDRVDALSLISMADAIYPLKGNQIQKVAEALSPSVFVLGKEFEINPDSIVQSTIDFLGKIKIPVEFHTGDIHYATTDLLTFSEREIYEKRKSEFQVSCKRQNIESRNLINSIEKWQSTKLTVIGDTIVDQFAACEALGMSAEAPVVVVREIEHKNFLGGAAVVASHIKSLGGKCDLISIAGEDENRDVVEKELLDLGIGNLLVYDASRPTTFKKRYIVENQKLFRVSRLEDKDVKAKIESELIDKLRYSCADSDGIVVSDFVYGVITERILKELKIIANEKNIPLFGDIQCSSQIGSVTKFKGFSVLTPNEREARIALRDKDCGLEKLSQKLIEITNCQKLIMKLGAEGFIAYDNIDPSRVVSQPFPALSVNPLDLSGAGDSILALISLGLSSKEEFMKIAALASCISSIAVETMGNTPISANKLREKLQEILS
tara:strand:+ start:4078 stop:5577 length:1500 start_codon:yes stop_codon:yes gene_type:complete